MLNQNQDCTNISGSAAHGVQANSAEPDPESAESQKPIELVVTRESSKGAHPPIWMKDFVSLNINKEIQKTYEGTTTILVYVDDILVTGSSLKLIKETKEALQQVFKMKDLGELRFFLGI
uniref:Reverse transcriptase Ty1/copia-type domain-containing protein n=1 Tax=Solanum lycopersicum TaxID=4081 RepID=A0A3Q7H8C3_SOLLC